MMPVQINEVVIRAVVDPVQQEPQSPAVSMPSSPSATLDAMAISEIVLEILKDKKER